MSTGTYPMSAFLFLICSMNRLRFTYLLLLLLASCSGSPESSAKPAAPVNAVDTVSDTATPAIPEKAPVKVTAALIIPKGTLRYQGRKLSLVQTLKDRKTTRGKLYVELLNDSTFRRLYIIDGRELKYFAGDHYFTNGSDTIPIDEQVKGFRFRKRNGKRVVIGGVNARGKFCTDDWTIQYVEDEKGFNNPYLD